MEPSYWASLYHCHLIESTQKSHEIAFFLATPLGMQDLISLTRDQTRAPHSGSAESFFFLI